MILYVDNNVCDILNLWDILELVPTWYDKISYSN